ncbi:MAG: response regulator transcription factor [Clostridiales bacterium]|nr:response regulator transcription factor [Clostridiales bacterium]
MSKIRVAVCEDIDSIRQHFVDLISSRNDMEIVGVARNGEEIKDVALKEKPDIILMDIQMETEKAGIAATKELSGQLPDTSIIIITVHDDDKLIFEAFEAGAVDYILKDVSQEELFDSIINAYNKDVVLSNNITQKIVNEFVKMKKEKKSLMYLVNMMCNLSPAEIDILRYLCMGKTRREIAEIRCVELVSIHTAITRMMKKLGYGNSREMIDELNQLGILPLIIEHDTKKK